MPPGKGGPSADLRQESKLKDKRRKGRKEKKEEKKESDARNLADVRMSDIGHSSWMTFAF